MRRLWATLALLAVFGATSAAQTVNVDAPLVFESQPTREDLTAAIPLRAREARQEGRALLCCFVRPTGVLTCATVAEAPEGLGYGEAARDVSRTIRLSRPSAAAWLRRNGGPMRIPLEFAGLRNALPAPAYGSEPLCGTRAANAQTVTEAVAPQ